MIAAGSALAINILLKVSHRHSKSQSRREPYYAGARVGSQNSTISRNLFATPTEKFALNIQNNVCPRYRGKSLKGTRCAPGCEVHMWWPHSAVAIDSDEHGQALASMARAETATVAMT